MGAGASLQEGAILSQDKLMSFQDKLENNVDSDMKTTVSYFAMRQLSLNLANNSDEPQLMRSQSMPNAVLPVNGKIAVPRLTSLLELLPEPSAHNRYRDAKHEQQVSEAKKPAGLFLNINVDPTSTLLSENNSAGSYAQEKGVAPRSPKVILSPRGNTIQFGNIRIREDGISPVVRSASGAGGGQAGASIPQVRGVDFLEVGSLGNGSSGVVMEAVHVPTLTIVALKMLPVYNKEKRQHVSRELGVLYKNLAEMRLVDESLDGACLEPIPENESQGRNPSRCPNLLSMYNAFVDSRTGMVNLVVEYMDGGSLQDLVQYGGCQDELVLRDIARQTLTGLAFLHANKNVHRDIKPANILCSSSGVVKIADFGISKVMDGTQGFANSFVGTVCYMSPERITGDAYGFPSDIWSFGLTMLAVAKGRFPMNDVDETMVSSKGGEMKLDMKTVQESDFEGAGGELAEEKAEAGSGAGDAEGGAWGDGGGYWGMIRAICEMSPPTAGPDFSEEFNHFINVCLRKDPADRYTARSLLFDSFLTDYGDESDDEGGLKSETSPSRKTNEGSRSSSRPNSGRPGQLDESPFSQSVKMHLQRRGSRGSEELLQKASDKLHSATASAAASPVARGHHATLEECDIFRPESLTLMDAIRLKHLEVIVSKLIQRDKLLLEQRTSAAADDKFTNGLVRVDSVDSGYDSIEDADMSSTVDDLFWKSAVDLNAFSPGKPSMLSKGQGAKQEKMSFNGSFNEDDSHSVHSGNSQGPGHQHQEASVASMMLNLADDTCIDEEERLRQRYQKSSFMPNSSFQRLNVVAHVPPALMPGIDTVDDQLKWDHLAHQLHLPEYVVKVLTEAKCNEAHSHSANQSQASMAGISRPRAVSPQTDDKHH